MQYKLTFIKHTNDFKLNIAFKLHKYTNVLNKIKALN